MFRPGFSKKHRTVHQLDGDAGLLVAPAPRTVDVTDGGSDLLHHVQEPCERPLQPSLEALVEPGELMGGTELDAHRILLVPGWDSV